MLGPVEGKLILMGADILSDALIDYYYEKKAAGKETITVDEILADAMKYRDIRKSEIAKVRARVESS